MRLRAVDDGQARQQFDTAKRNAQLAAHSSATRGLPRSAGRGANILIRALAKSQEERLQNGRESPLRAGFVHTLADSNVSQRYRTASDFETRPTPGRSRAPARRGSFSAINRRSGTQKMKETDGCGEDMPRLGMKEGGGRECFCLPILDESSVNSASTDDGLD